MSSLLRKTPSLLFFTVLGCIILVIYFHSTSIKSENLNDSNIRRTLWLTYNNDPKTIEVKNDQTRPTGLRLLLVGDSSMRYQYLSMAYFLRYGQWIGPPDSQILWEENFASPADFYTESTRMLHPYEVCDCYRPNGSSQPWEGTENRYFYDPQLDNFIAYIQAYGHLSTLHGRLWPCTSLNTIQNNELEKLEIGLNVPLNDIPPTVNDDWGESLNFFTQYMFISEDIEYMERKRPTHVVLNSGVWSSDFCTDANKRQGLFQSLRENDMIPVWKTTTFPENHYFPSSSCVLETDAAMCALGGQGGCLDVSWTENINSQNYYDMYHFSEPNIYRFMNEELLHLMGHLQDGYVRETIENIKVR